jgi:hypothetical protein
MSSTENDAPVHSRKMPPYCWTMRIIGFVLAASAAYLLSNNYFSSSQSFWLMLLATGVGVITFYASWLPRYPDALLHAPWSRQVNPGDPKQGAGIDA